MSSGPDGPYLKESVTAFWQNEACGERYGDEQEAVRYLLEPEIISFARFDGARGVRVLEVGVGMGADLMRFARAGAEVTGVDLTDRAIELTGRRIAAEGLTAHLRTADAEHLPFPDRSFDLVYSWGVLHHTPNTAAALRECQRVLAPGGRLAAMLYHRRSYVALAAWARHCLGRGRPFQSISQGVALIESPGTKAFTVNEMRSMLSGLQRLSIRPVLTHWDRRVAPGVGRFFGNRFGWFLLVEGYAAVDGSLAY